MVRLTLTTLRFLFAPSLAALVFVSAIPDSAAAPAPAGFAGTWALEQIPPGGTPRRQGTITITQSGAGLAGTMRLDGAELPLSNVRETGGVISFSAPTPGSPGLVLNYSGAIQGNQLGVASQDLGSGSYTLTARRTRGAPQAQIAQTAPPAPVAAPAPPPAVRAPTAPAVPPPPAARAPAAAPPPTLGPAAQGDYVARLLGQGAPSATPAPPAAPLPEPPQVVASAPPPPAPPAPARRAPEPPPAPGPELEGSWSAEQTIPGSIGPSAATLSFTREGDRVAGVLRSDGQEFPLFDVRQAGAEVTFSVVIPGTPYETVVYRGMVSDDHIDLAGLGEQQGVYGLMATRQGPSAAAAPPPAASEPAPAEPMPMPQIALAPPPPPAPVAAAPPPPQVALAPPPPAAPVATPEPPASPAPASGSLDATLQGTWVVELTDTGSATPIPATLAFDGDKASLRVGVEDLPLYEVTQVGADLAFTVIVPGTPYMTVRYSGVVADGMMQLASLDEGRGVSTLQARRVDENAMPGAGPAAPMQASLPPTQVARPATPPRAPSPASALPLKGPPSGAPSGPPAQLPLPVLRDVPPNGLALTPIMGWSSRQKLGSRTDDATIRQAVEGLVESGLNLIGYTYVEIGDGWQGARDAERVLHPNERFPDMKALGDYIHSQGLKFGLTASVSPKSCNGFEGSYGYEAQDARTFAEWGIDYVVFDWCGSEAIDYTQEEMRAAFQLMGESLRMTGRDIVYAVSQKGRFAVEQWGSKTGANIWRTSPNEIDENWASIEEAGFGQNGKESATKPGAWNDPGLLQAGNTGLTIDQARMQLNLWAVLAAPMMLGNDVRIMMRETVALLTNREVIAVNQDKAGRQGKRVAQAGDTQVWARQLDDGSLAVAFFNTGTRTTSVAVTWEQLGIEGPRLARDLWWHENLGTANAGYRVVLTGGTSMLLKLSR